MSAADWLAAIHEVELEASRGPWRFGRPGDGLGVTAKQYTEVFLRDPDGPCGDVWLVVSGEREAGNLLAPALTGDGPTSEANAAFIAVARTAMPKMRAALEAVLALHPWQCSGCEGTTEDCGPICGSCYDAWPCPTVAAITEALT